MMGFRTPLFIIGIWRGGAPIGIAVQSISILKKWVTDHIAVAPSSYYGIDQQSKIIKGTNGSFQLFWIENA